MRFFFCLLFFPFAIGLNAQVEQDSIPFDSVAHNYLEQGTYFFRLRNYSLALDAFEAAYHRPAHQWTTTALFYTGLSYYYLENWPMTRETFHLLKEKWPQSGYLEEIDYHLYSISLRTDSSIVQIWETLNELWDLSDTTMESSLSEDAFRLSQDYLFFRTSDEQLEEWMERATAERQLMLVEPLAYHYYQDGDSLKVREMYEYFRDSLRFYSTFIEDMLSGEPEVEYREDEYFRVAVIIPANWDEEVPFLEEQSFPNRKKLPFEYYEGLEMGLKKKSIFPSRRLWVEVYDSRRDSVTVSSIIQNLEISPPDLIVGDIYNSQSRMIGEWSTLNRIPQIVPLSPSAELAEGKDNIFIAHPSAIQHGQSMAVYAKGMLQLKKIAVWSDGQESSEALAESFSAMFDTLGGKVVRFRIPDNYDEDTRESIIEKVREMRVDTIDGVYIPIQSNQEAAGLIISQMKAYEMNVKVMGGPHWWKRYENIDRELKETYRMLISTSYYVDKRDPDFIQFQRDYLKEYHFIPSKYAIQGYDLGAYVKEVLSQYEYRQGRDLASFIRNFAPFHGLHSSTDFRGEEVNQSVNILQYHENGVECLTCPKKLSLNSLVLPED